MSVSAALAGIAVLGTAAMLRPRPPGVPTMPPPMTLRVGTEWTDVDLAALRPAPFAGVTASATLRFRTDGSRVQLVSPGSGVAIHTTGVGKVEVRAVRGTADVTFTPQAR